MNSEIEVNYTEIVETIENQIRQELGGEEASSPEEFDQLVREKVEYWVSTQGPAVIIGLVLAQEIYCYDIEGMDISNDEVTPLKICSIVLENSLRDIVTSRLFDLAPFEDEDFEDDFDTNRLVARDSREL